MNNKLHCAGLKQTPLCIQQASKAEKVSFPFPLSRKTIMCLTIVCLASKVIQLRHEFRGFRIFFFFNFNTSKGGFHVTSSPPCSGGRRHRSLIIPFVRPPAFVRFTIVICVSRDWLKTTYSCSVCLTTLFETALLAWFGSPFLIVKMRDIFYSICY